MSRFTNVRTKQLVNLYFLHVCKINSEPATSDELILFTFISNNTDKL